MEIIESIIHGVLKSKDTSGTDSIRLKPRTTLLELNERLLKLGDDVLQLYGKLANGYGTLGRDPELHRFPKYLDDYLSTNTSFLGFSTKTLAVIAESMSHQRFSTTSYPVFFHYQNQGRDWVLIAVLKLKEGVGIDEETLDLNDSLFFDVGNLREAARIDLGKWSSDEQPYLSFIKRGSGADGESSQYFREALSCLDYTDAKFNTNETIRAIDGYGRAAGWSPDQKIEARNKFHDYCKEKKELGEPVNLTALSGILNDQQPESFVNFVREEGFEINETFSPDPNSYKRLQRLSKRFGSISLGFTVDDLVQERVSYREEDDSIILTNPPRDLIEDIRKAIGEGSVSDE